MLLHLLGGIDRSSAGTILFRDQELTGLDASWLTLFRRRHVGFVFQFYNLITSVTALENVAMATEVAPNPRATRAMIEMVGLAERADHFPAQLSGGEQQRVAIARAVAKAPDVVLCDEPTGALDYRSGIKVLEVLRQVNRELGTTLLLITHSGTRSARDPAAAGQRRARRLAVPSSPWHPRGRARPSRSRSQPGGSCGSRSRCVRAGEPRARERCAAGCAARRWRAPVSSTHAAVRNALVRDLRAP